MSSRHNQVFVQSRGVPTRITTRDNTSKVKGIITKETKKDILLKLEDRDESWFPKSNIKSHYSLGKKTAQIFLIDSWILEKDKIA